MSITLPTNPSVSSASVGKDFIFLLKINTGTAAVPVWTTIGGQRGASLKRTADEIDVSDKVSGGWKAVKAGLRSWGIDLDGLVVLSDVGLQALEQGFMEGVEINVLLLYPDGTVQTGWGSVTDFSLDTPHDGEATLKGTIGGNGELTVRTPSISPLTATMSLAAAADKVFSILPTTTAVATVKAGATTLELSTDYTYSGRHLDNQVRLFGRIDRWRLHFSDYNRRRCNSQCVCNNYGMTKRGRLNCPPLFF